MSRRCPRCTFTLEPHRPPSTVPGAGAEVDVCPRCHGAFFDTGDAKAMLGENAEPKTWERATAAVFKGTGKLACPDGHGPLSIYLLQAPPGSGVDVDVDVCSTCMGMWLDQWEAVRISQATRVLHERPDAIPLDARKIGAGWYLFQLFSGMPLEEYNPVRRRPLVVLSLVVACVLAFVITRLVEGSLAVSLTWVHLAAAMWLLFTFGDNIEDRVGRLRFIALFLALGAVAVLAQLGAAAAGAPAVAALDVSAPATVGGAVAGAIAGLMGVYAALFPKVRVYQVLFFVRFSVPALVYPVLWLALLALLERASDDVWVPWWALLGGSFAGIAWGLVGRARFGDGARARRIDA